MGFGAKLPTPSPDSASDIPNPNPKALEGLSTPDLTAYGLIPEFLGRLPIISTLHPLSVSDLVRILSEPRNALIKQYQATFESYGSELRFTHKALEAIAAEGLKRGGGARGLRGVLEEVLQDAMFEVPGSVSWAFSVPRFSDRARLAELIFRALDTAW
jgi:ATP-dependent Clp protease ATP-binding subunit ClpX